MYVMYPACGGETEATHGNRWSQFAKIKAMFYYNIYYIQIYSLSKKTKAKKKNIMRNWNTGRFTYTYESGSQNHELHICMFAFLGSCSWFKNKSRSKSNSSNCHHLLIYQINLQTNPLSSANIVHCSSKVMHTALCRYLLTYSLKSLYL